MAGCVKNRTLVSLQADFVNIQWEVISTEREKSARYRSTDDCGSFMFAESVTFLGETKEGEESIRKWERRMQALNIWS